MVDFVPAPHHIEAGEKVDILMLGSAGDQLDHARGFRLHDHLWRKLRIDKDDISTGRADLGETLADRHIVVVEFIIADHRIGAKLPEDQVGLGSDHVRTEALEHVADFLTADATVEHNDRMARKTLRQFDREPTRIGGGR